MQVFLTGADGYIGRHLVKAGCKPLKCNVVERNDVERAVKHASPDLVIHLAGKSSPDYCELHTKDSIKANVDGTHYVMEACVKYEVPAVLLSSAQIWGGGFWESWFNRHAENSRKTPPVNNYGMQKVVAEFVTETSNMNGRKESKIIRTSFVFDKERFCRELSDLKHGVFIDAPHFIKRSFIHMDDFVYLVSEYCKRFHHMPRVLHLAGSQTVSYHQFWQEVARQYGFDKKLIRGRRVERNVLYAAKRPHYGGLDTRLSQELGFKSFDYIGGIARMKSEDSTDTGS